MKIPLRFQVTSFDCAPVSLINAISYLFDREEIPAELVREISTYTLDCYSSDGNSGEGGTSRDSIRMICNWITNFSKAKDFGIDCKILEPKDITLSNVTKYLTSGGVVLIRLWQSEEHYVIATKIDDKNIYIFDPYYLEENYYNNDKDIEMVFNEPFSHNRIVTLERFFSESTKDFALGKFEKRECVLIKRKKHG